MSGRDLRAGEGPQAQFIRESRQTTPDIAQQIVPTGKYLRLCGTSGVALPIRSTGKGRATWTTILSIIQAIKGSR